jgi:hypothetical protein
VLLALARAAASIAAVVAGRATRRLALAIAGYLVAGGLFVVSLVFLTLSGYRAVARALDDVYAALIFGCLYLVAGLVTLLIVQFRRR